MVGVGLTVIVIVVVFGQVPDVVNVYKVVAILFNAGDHVPVNGGTLVDDVGKAVIVAPEQTAGTWVNVGVAGNR